MATPKKTATVLGFGGRAPPKILGLLSKAVTDFGVYEIIPRRSQAFELALCEGPHRVFLRNDNPEEKEKQATNGDKKEACCDLLIYCLPSSVTEYLNASEEASQVRSALLKETGKVLVSVYDPKINKILGAGDDDVASVLAALSSGDRRRQQVLAVECLTALSKLDQELAAQQVGPERREDVVIVVGSGGREHALAVALAQSPLVSQVICCPGNGGTAVEGGKISNAVGGKQDNETVIRITKEVGASMVVVGPEAPLVDGLVDALAKECPDVMAFGPTQAASQLEASKAFSKDFLQRHGIPTAKYRNFTDAAEAIAYVESLDESDRQVVKASGLAAGKGVLLPNNKEETIKAVKEVMTDKAFGAAGDTCVIESFITGPEASCFALCDGKTAKLMPASQDHKCVLDGD